ncbi:MAG: PEGA domain-containing protein [Deltaproteobacteria bacterium]|nr:MAG: PEGA domain-containing protein [Deltaproteobacteria bacterium]
MDEAAGGPVDPSHEAKEEELPAQETKLIAPEDIGPDQDEVVPEEQATVLFKPDEVMPPAQYGPPARSSSGTEPRRRLPPEQTRSSRRARTGTEPIRGRPIPARETAGSRHGPVLYSFLAGLAFAGLAAGLVLFFTGDDRNGEEQPSDYAVVSPVSPSPSAPQAAPLPSTTASTKHNGKRAKPYATGDEPSAGDSNGRVAAVSLTPQTLDKEKAAGEADGRAEKKGQLPAGKPDKKEPSKNSPADDASAAKAPTMSRKQEAKPALALARGEAVQGGRKVLQKERLIGKGKKAAPRPDEKAAGAEKRAGKKAPRNTAAARLLSVRVESSPPGAEILLNGKRSGKTPRRFELEPGRNYFIILKKKGYKPYFHGLKPGRPRKVRISAKLQPKAAGGKRKFGYLVANTRPWARVLVDGKDSGLWTPIPPAKKLRLPAGRHRVTFRTQDGKELTVTVTIEEGKTAKVIKVIK